MIGPNGAQRICSLLPSATEIVCALGLGDCLVAVTHECDFPPQAREKSQATTSVIDSDGLSSREIDQAVRDSLADMSTIYHLDRDLLERLQPDLILTQELCDVCAVGTHEVQEVVSSLSSRPHVVSLEPRTLVEVLDSILQVGRLCGELRRAIDLVDQLRDRLEAVQSAVAGRPSVPVLTLEWLDPVFVGGHWVPEMVELAGGADVLGKAGTPSREATWDEIAAAAPQAIVAMPCGFDLNRSMQEMNSAVLPRAWQELPAVQNGNLFVVDGSSYFSRPGPRLIEGVEILASLLHPDAFSKAPPASYARY